MNWLEAAASDFFIDNHPFNMTYQEIVPVMKSEYYSPTRQAKVQAELETLRLPTIMAHKNITSTTVELEKLMLEINSLIPQTPLSFRDGEHKFRCLSLSSSTHHEHKQQQVNF